MREQNRRLFWTYDSSADVLHATTDPSLPAYGEPLQNFEEAVIVMKDAETDRVVGIRVLGAKANGLGAVALLIYCLRMVEEPA